MSGSLELSLGSTLENFILESYAFQSKDYMVLPGTPWNYALLLAGDVMFDNDLQPITFPEKQDPGHSNFLPLTPNVQYVIISPQY